MSTADDPTGQELVDGPDGDFSNSRLLEANASMAGKQRDETARDRLARRLSELDDHPTARHAELYEQIHRELQDALASAQQSSPSP